MKALNILKIFLVSIITLGSFTASGFLTVEPIAGYERVQKFSPRVYTKDRLIYGVGATFGIPLISLEAQLTQGNDSETFPTENLTIKEEVINAMVGLRSNIGFGPIGFYLRGGGHARQSKITATENGVTTVTEPAIRVSPYAGTGIYLSTPILRVNAGVTGIFTGKPKGSDVDYQATLGFALKI